MAQESAALPASVPAGEPLTGTSESPISTASVASGDAVGSASTAAGQSAGVLETQSAPAETVAATSAPDVPGAVVDAGSALPDAAAPVDAAELGPDPSVSIVDPSLIDSDTVAGPSDPDPVNELASAAVQAAGSLSPADRLADAAAAPLLVTDPARAAAPAEPVVDTTAALGAQAAQDVTAAGAAALDGVATTGEPVVEAVATAAEPAAAVSEPVVEAVETIAAPAEPVIDTTIAALIEELVSAGVPAATDNVADAPATAGSLSDSVAAAGEAITDSVAATGQLALPALEAAGALVESGTDALGTVGDVVAGVADGLAPSSDELAPVLSGSDSILVSAAAASLVGYGIYASRTSGPAGSGCSSFQILFTSVRLIPCLVADSIQRSVSSVAAHAPNFVGPRDVSPSATSSATDERRQPWRVGSVEALRDGFARGARRFVDDDGETAIGSRLMMQVGMLLGLVYLAFLTVWFWATRLRWDRRL